MRQSGHQQRLAEPARTRQEHVAHPFFQHALHVRGLVYVHLSVTAQFAEMGRIQGERRQGGHGEGQGTARAETPSLYLSRLEAHREAMRKTSIACLRRQHARGRTRAQRGTSGATLEVPRLYLRGRDCCILSCILLSSVRASPRGRKRFYSSQGPDARQGGGAERLTGGPRAGVRS